MEIVCLDLEGVLDVYKRQTLPFISYGGTSIVFLLGEMGLALNVSRCRK